MTAVRQQLDSLRSNLADKCPALHASLRPGLSDSAIDALVGPLQPFRLPAAARELYRWADGQGGYDAKFIPGGRRFLPLADAIEERQEALDLNVGNWNPLWLPLFAFEGDIDLVVSDTHDHTSGLVLRRYLQDPNVYVRHTDVEAMIRVLAGGWAHDVYRLDDNGRLTADEEREENLRRLHSSAAYPFVEELGRSWFGAVGTDGWPESWKAAVGLSSADEVPRGGAMPIGRVLAEDPADGRRVVIAGQVVGLTGSGRGCVVRVLDASGDVLVACPRDVTGVRDLRIRDTFEFEALALEDPAFARVGGPAPLTAIRVVRLG
jgi:hypothetical protein